MSKRGQVIGKTPFGEAKQYTEEELQAIAKENAEAKVEAEKEPEIVVSDKIFWTSFNGWRIDTATGLLYPPEGNEPAKYNFTYDTQALAAGLNPMSHATEKTARRIHRVIQRLVADRVVGVRRVAPMFAYPFWEIAIQGTDPINAGAQAFDLVISGYQWFFLKFRDQCKWSGVNVNNLSEEEALKDL